MKYDDNNTLLIRLKNYTKKICFLSNHHFFLSYLYIINKDEFYKFMKSGELQTLSTFG